MSGEIAATGSYGALSVGGTAALIVAANPRRRRVYIRNTHATQTLHIGFDSSVTTATGYELTGDSVPDQASLVIEGYAGPIWAIASGAATTGNYLEIGKRPTS